jgi:hypothetical protein
VVTYNERPAECVIAYDLVPPVQLAREAAEERNQHGHRSQDLKGVTTEVLVRPHEGVDHEEDQGDEDGDKELVGAAPVEEDDPTYTIKILVQVQVPCAGAMHVPCATFVQVPCRCFALHEF